MRLLSAGFVALLALGGMAECFAQLDAVPIAMGIAGPLGYYPDPTDPTLAYVVTKGGRIRILKNDVLQSGDFLKFPDGDLSTTSERGLLGFAFHPGYKTNGYAFAYFNNPDGSIQVARFTRDAATNTLKYSTRYNIITIPHPDHDNHNGGTIRFGPHGYLFIGTGDGGGSNDPPNNSQNLAVLLGKLIRINIDKDSYPTDVAKNYTVPKDNPFVGTAGAAPEIYAYGLRNPFKFSIDKPTGNIVIADVGQAHREEIDIIPAGTSGQNFGWRAREGFIDNQGVSDPAPPNAIDPIYDYAHDAFGECITGGYVYRGKRLGAAYVGRYFFADYISGHVGSIDPFAPDVSSTFIDHTADLALTADDIVSIDLNSQKELVIVTISGTIYLIKKTAP